MKKSLVNRAITLALSTALLSSSALLAQVHADTLNTADNNNSNDNTTETYMLSGMGAGATAGAVVAGPVGVVIGGIIGAFVGESQLVADNNETPVDLTRIKVPESITDNNGEQTFNAEFSHNLTDAVYLAQAGDIKPVVEKALPPVQNELIDILTTDLSLDIYFRSGSTAIETFYPVRLAAIASLMNTLDQLNIHLDGYTDRRGNKQQNIALATQRINEVREQLVKVGVDENRIISKAFGEMKMISSAGDLDAYTFDRKVVIRFERIPADSIQHMNTALSEADTENIEPVIADVSSQF